MIPFINRKIIYPLYFSWNRDNRLQHCKRLEHTQWLSRDEILFRQLEQFKHLIKYAYNNSKFYKNLYSKESIYSEDIQSFDDIKKLPVICKNDLQNHIEEMFSTSFPKSQRYENSSGGSTGRPTVFYGDKKSLPKLFGAYIRSDKWTGWNIGEKSIYLWGADRDINMVHAYKEKIVQALVYRAKILNAFDIKEKDMELFSEILIKERPSLIVAYSSVAVKFASFIRDKDIKGIKPKGVICSAETLTQKDRNLIEGVFHCKVQNRYGSREVGLIAAECEKQEGLHINAENLLVEFHPINDEKEDGEVIITDFNNYAMPLIRYNMGDISGPITKNCSCGRGLPLMSPVTGRTSDFISHPEGHLIHGEYFSHLFYGMRGIKQFQVIQDSLSELKVKIVSDDLTSDMEKSIKQKVREIMGDNVKTIIQEVDSIPILSSGKYRFVISNIKIENKSNS